MVDNTIRLSASDLACDDGYDSSWSVVKSHPPVPATDRDVSDALDFCDDEDLEDDCAPSSLAVPPVNFGEIVIQDSTDVHIGNKTFYNGSVTIKQFVISKDEESKLGRLPPTPTSNGTLARSCSHLCEPTKDENQKEQNKLRYLKSPYTIGGIIIMLLVCTLLTVYLVTGFTANVEDDDGLPMNVSLRTVARSGWNADEPRSKTPLVTPVKYAIVLHSAGIPCNTLQQCSTAVRLTQSGYFDNKFDDVPYNFFIGGDGRVYEGRGWDLKGAFGREFNKCALGFGFIGTFSAVLPPQRQMDAFELLLDEGVRLGKLSENYTLLLHSQVSQTLSPGQKLASLLQTWDRWIDCQKESCKC